MKYLILLLSLFVTNIFAITVTTFDHDGDGVVSGSGADAHVFESSPNTTGNGAMKVRTQNSLSHLEVGFMRFDLSSVDANTITNAKLGIYDFRFDESPVNGRNFEVYGVTNQSLDNWSETGITWNNAPGITDDGTPFNNIDVNGDALLLGSFTYSGSGNDGFSSEISLAGLTSFIQNDNNNQVTLILTRIDDGADTLHHLGSKELSTLSRLDSSPVLLGSLAPQLILDGAEFSDPVVPEPSSCLLMALALAFSLRRRK